jgi:NitT/TauT family transport system substrate-binding protein
MNTSGERIVSCQIALALVVVPVAVLGFALAPAGASQELPASEPVEIQLNWKPEPQFGGFYQAAQTTGRPGSKVRLSVKAGGSGTPTIQMLSAGSSKYAVVSADELVVAASQGADVVALVAVFQTNPQALIAHEERGFQAIEDLFLNPGVLAWQQGLPYAQFLLNRVRSKAKGKRLPVRLVPYAGGIAAFARDPKLSQQGFATSEPLLMKAANLKPRVFLVADAGFNPYTTVLATRRRHLTESPEQVREVVRRVREGWVQYLQNPEPSHELIARLNPAMKKEALVASEAAQRPFVLGNGVQAQAITADQFGRMTETRWTELVEQMKQIRLIKQKPESSSLYINLD